MFWKLQNFSLNIDAKNRPLFFWKRVKEVDFLNVTQRKPFFKYNAKNWTLFLSLRMDLFFIVRVKELNFLWIWLTELNLFFNMTHRIEPFFECDSMIFFFFKKIEALNLLFYYSMNWTSLKIRVTELNPSFWYYSKNWTLFKILLQELNFFSRTFLSIRLKELNFFFFRIWPKELNYFEWLKELNFFDSRNWTFFDMTQIMELFFVKKTKHWTFFSLTQKIDFF